MPNITDENILELIQYNSINKKVTQLLKQENNLKTNIEYKSILYTTLKSIKKEHELINKELETLLYSIESKTIKIASNQ